LVPSPRPAWAPALERWTERIARIGRRLLPRPTEAALSALAEVDRPGAVEAVPEALRAQAATSLRDPLMLGRAAFARGDYAEGLHHFGVQLGNNEHDPWAWHGRGDCLQLMGAPAEAGAAYARAAALAPREPLHLEGQANAAAALGEEGSATKLRSAAAELRRPRRR
jgi:Flp pilus assembly protein TadD